MAVTTLDVLRVFGGPDGRGGNPLGVFRDGASIAAERRQAVAAELGFSETVFVDGCDTSTMSMPIFTPAAERPFAGDPIVGTAWLLAERSAGRSPVRTPHTTMSVTRGSSACSQVLRQRSIVEEVVTSDP